MAIQEAVDEASLITNAVALSFGCTGILVGNGEPDAKSMERVSKTANSFFMESSSLKLFNIVIGKPFFEIAVICTACPQSIPNISFGFSLFYIRNGAGHTAAARGAERHYRFSG